MSPTPEPMSLRRILTVAAVGAVWGAAGLLGLHWLGLLERPLTALNRVDPVGPTVLFVVMDTVRADHLSACGYAQPTSPYLAALAKQGSLSCGAVAPGSWTFPSHASFFTGLPVPEHGSDFTGQAEGTDFRHTSIRPLPAGPETLAEHLGAEGHQALGLSGNPVLAEVSGLHRGFERFETAPRFGAWYGEGLLRPLRELLRTADPERPLFLFVNIADAHDPWEPVPADSPVAPPVAEGLFYFTIDKQTQQIERGTWARYVTGEMSRGEQEQTRARVTALYDHALYQADQTLEAVVRTVTEHGWADAGLRLVITSDHGEFLGEHGLLRHGRYLYEGNQRVPLLYAELPPRSETRTSAPAVPADLLPSLLSAREAYWLVRDGARPEPALPVSAVAYPDEMWAEQSGGRVGVHTSAARWEPGGGKELWMSGRHMRLDLTEDPEEQRPLDLPPDQASAELLALVDEVQALAASDEGIDPELLEALHAAGYVDR